MMLGRLPYRVQMPLGLSMAVVLAAGLITAVTATISANSARRAMIATFERASVLLAAQSRPLLAADDVWRTFVLLRDTSDLLPGTAAGHARTAVVDLEGVILASSDPRKLATGRPLDDGIRTQLRASSQRPTSAPHAVERPDESWALIQPIRSEDGLVLGYVYVEVDASVFQPDWLTLATPASIGALIAVLLLVPLGWTLGGRMAEPVARIARCIEDIGRKEPAQLRAELPRSTDPELGRISEAVSRLTREMEVRERAEQRALSAERMAALGRMTAAVAHEVNNPLGGLINAVGTLRLRGDSTEVRLRTVDLIDRGLQQVRSTVAALLPQARVEDRVFEPEDLDDVAVLAGPVARSHGVRLVVESSSRAAARTPAAQLRQVILNLILNAVAAAGEGGTVTVTLAIDDDRIGLRVANSGRRLTPQGLEEAIWAESGNDPRGFGLWVCREIATLSGGELHLAESEHGTVLEFWIPNRERHESAVAH